jgi:flavin reductase (DIM6/NTAB) family NADH-FMN oxidoreductase RutF
MDIDPVSLTIEERYKLLIGAIVPRPIAWVSTLSPEGAPNLAPFSFFNGVSSNPMTLLFCPANRPDGTDKDTLRNIKATREFVVNVVPHRLVRQMSACAEDLPFGESEWDLARLAKTPSRTVRPARVAESPFAFECEAAQILHLNPGAPSGGNIVIGLVKWIHAAAGIVNPAHRVDPAALDAIGRMAGLGYCTTRDRFDVPWGRNALGP